MSSDFSSSNPVPGYKKCKSKCLRSYKEKKDQYNLSRMVINILNIDN